MGGKMEKPGGQPPRVEMIVRNGYVITLNRPEMIPTTNMIRNLFYASRSKSVHTVIVNGRIVLEDGVLAAINEPEMLAHINAASLALIARMGKTIEPNRVRNRL